MGALVIEARWLFRTPTFWDPKVEEATLLIGWESKEVCKKIPQTEINLVQQDFEKIAREETGVTSGNPFPLIFEGELNPE